ncbi:class F sortase [Nocardioides sp. Leaf307]|uniref:class F sortase n=1 Tax=Nocardioides sp. Leaf307 TaxID=1736331 RepID=UPI0007026F18|nr:class F sortase [Nocardioides sp. Leaf307]KQQ42575.1 hypothetical protein ASF50_00435 [Nocardioides sp. Leaf307]
MGTDSPAAPGAGAGVTARLGALTTALLVLGVGLVLGGLVLPSGTDDSGPSYADLGPADPVRLQVRSLRIDAPVVPVAVTTDRVLDPPTDVLDVGWWDASAQPGAESGQTVIAGHTVHTGGGSLDRLGDVRRGAAVDVTTPRGRMRYEVTRVVVYDKDQLAANAQQVFGQDRRDGRLVLISCTDWDGAAYASNVVVFGRALGEPV